MRAIRTRSNQKISIAHVIVVGEPSGETPNQYGDPVAVRLPFSGIELHISTHYYRESTTRLNLTVPTRPAALSSRDYRDGVDPALVAIQKDISGNAQVRSRTRNRYLRSY